MYEVKSKGSDPNQLNTLSTEKGETYILTLPDKSKVWLNAASSLTYTAALMERGVRRVKLTGEAYFEIFKDKAHPFVVESKEQQVEVLGTHFNINAYEDEFVVKTTLLEGSVKISNAGSRSSILKPGQQAVLSDRGIVLKNVEAEDAIDWKSGYFMFNNESLESGLKRIARWYNVQIIYEDESLKGETFFGRISKFEKISKVFSMLERTDIVRFKIEGNKIFVRKKK
ncbi:fec operon regulator FecR [compost metagenome]